MLIPSIDLMNGRIVQLVHGETLKLAFDDFEYWIERFARLPVEIDVASEYRYREAPVDDGGLTIVVSQSGETADTLASLRYVKEKGSRTVGVVNVPDSSIARLTDASAPTLAGPEIGDGPIEAKQVE